MALFVFDGFDGRDTTHAPLRWGRLGEWGALCNRGAVFVTAGDRVCSQPLGSPF